MFSKAMFYKACVDRLCFVKQCFARLVLQGYVLNSILCPDDVHMVVMENSTKLFQKSFMGWDITSLVVKWMTIMGLKIHSKTIMKTLDLQLLVPMPGGRVNEYSWAWKFTKKMMNPLDLQCLDAMPGGKVCDNHLLKNSLKGLWNLLIFNVWLQLLQCILNSCSYTRNLETLKIS